MEIADSSVVQISHEEWAATPVAVQSLALKLVAVVQEQTGVALQTLNLDRLLRVYEHSLKPRTPRQVVMISNDPIPRGYKYANSLRRLGWEVILISQEAPKVKNQSCFSKIFICSSQGEILNKCLEFSPQVYHYFTGWEFERPAFLIAAGLSPILFDDYDVVNGCLIENPPYPPPATFLQERYCLEHAQALTVRDGRLRAAKRGGVRVRSVHLCLDGAMSQAQALLERSPKRTDGLHAVYIGHLTIAETPAPRNFHLELARVLAKAGIHYHVYPWDYGKFDEYRQAADQYLSKYNGREYFHLHPFVAADELIREISQYHFGIDILTTTINRTPDDSPVYKLEMTRSVIDNKIFDYMSAGLYTYHYDGRWMRRVIERYGLGNKVSSLEDLAAQAKQRGAAPLPPIPAVLTTDYWAQRLIRTYESLGAALDL